MTSKKYYAVKKGLVCGIFETWFECEVNVKGVPGAEFKSFKRFEDACLYLGIDVPEAHNKVIDDEDNNDVVEDEVELPHIIENDKIIEAYVDGSYNIKLGVVGYGLLLVKNDKIVIRDMDSSDDELLAKSRNVSGELMGARRAVTLAIANMYQKVIIYHDYKGVDYFATGKWRRNKEISTMYYEFMQSKMQDIEIEFIKVDAHTGNTYNDLADNLAKVAVGILPYYKIKDIYLN